jgi:hypothetical protein
MRGYPIRLVLSLGALLLPPTLAAKAKPEELLQLTDDTLEAALAVHPLMLVNVGVPDCGPCNLVSKKMRAAGKELRAKAPGVTLAQLTITTQDSPVIGKIVQGALTLPKVLIFRDGEAMDFIGDPAEKASIVEVMLREVSRDSIQTLKTVKQAERFLHLDSWSSLHSDEEQPPRVVGFFPSNSTPTYQVFRETAAKLQGMIAFGECFDAPIQKKFMGAKASKSVVQVVKADKRERKLTYDGPLAVQRMTRWVATHSLALVQDLTTESSIEAHMARGVPVFLLLMPDEYEESLSEIMVQLRKVAARVRDRLLFAYGFKDTEPWPQFAQSLQIPREGTGAFWMIMGNNMELTGRDWSAAWLRPPSLGFEIYAMQARGDERAKDVTLDALEKFVDGFLAQVDQARPEPKYLDAPVEVEVAVAEETAPAAGTVEAEAVKAAVNHDKELRKAISAMEMNFNSGVANLKKVLDELKDTPNLLAGRAPGLTSTLSATEMKLKKDVLGLKRKLMDIAQKKDEL